MKERGRERRGRKGGKEKEHRNAEKSGWRVYGGSLYNPCNPKSKIISKINSQK